jgi:predicted metal-dependent peptidase
MVGEGEAAKFPKDKNAEFYYTLLRDQDSNPSDGEDESEQGKQGGPGNGDGDGDSDGQGNSESKSGEGKAAADPGGCGGVLDAGDEAESKDSEAEWECAVAQAEQASKSRGTLPGGLARAVSEVLRPAADWRSILREFISSKAKNDYSWTRPNRRFVHQGLYLPGLHSEELGEVVIVVDCSGSICRKTIDVFANEAEAALSAYDCTATILYHDAVVTGREEWTRSDGPLKLNPVGGGGTSHKPVFEEIERAAQMPTCVICLTDLYTDFPAEPSVPTLWAVIGENDSEPPFGRVVKITS